MASQNSGTSMDIRNPGSLTQLHSEIDRIFDHFSSGWPGKGMSWMKPFKSAEGLWAMDFPAVDVTDKKKSITVKAEIPGLKKGDVNVELIGNMLTIYGEKKQERTERDKDNGRLLSERQFGSFRRSLALPEGVDRDRIKAKFRKGVLTVKLPKTAKAQKMRRTVKIKTD